MLKIGDFAKMFNVSIKTVRFYEEKGLLNPSFVDIYTGYRYYDEENIKEMSKILALKKLGLELEEIKNLDNSKIEEKIEDYENKILMLQQNIYTLKTLSVNELGEIKNMKTFINDEAVIGKWKLLGIANTKEDYKHNNLLDDATYLIKMLYLLPEGEEYWVISWSKNIIYINGRENPYEVEGNLMYVTIKGLYGDNEQKLAIYEKIDDKRYSIDEIKIKDDTNIPFVKDEVLEGFWTSVDFVKNIESFNSHKPQTAALSLEKISAFPDGKLTVYYKSGKIIDTKYSKNKIINLILPDTVSNYEYRQIDDKLYLFIEWKSGDYVFGGIISGYYVFTKDN